MTFAEKLKNIRKQAGMSQEQLAEKLGVSRQAVTKWETEVGVPDIENLIAISNLFNISIDELLLNEKVKTTPSDFLYESITAYDIAENKHFDMKLGGCSRLVITGNSGGKIKVRLASNTLQTVANDFKVKIDDIKKRIDIDVLRMKGTTEAIAKQAITIFVSIPISYLNKIEVTANTEAIEINSLECNSMELDIKAKHLILDGVVGEVSVNCNSDMEIGCKSLSGVVELNQISATSKITIPKDVAFSTRVKGIGTSISYEKDGKPTAPFCVDNADNSIELNGMKSELIICTSK